MGTVSSRRKGLGDKDPRDRVNGPGHGPTLNRSVAHARVHRPSAQVGAGLMRLLPWTGEGGRPCYLSTDRGDSFMSGLADDLEPDCLEMAGRGSPSTLVYRWRRDPRIVVRVRRLLVWHLAAWDMQRLADVAELVV